MEDNNLSKSLYHAVMKALGSKEGKEHAVKHAMKDLEDPNMIAEVPGNHIPATKEGVLHKDISVSEMHQQKQANAEAAVGMRPGEQKMQKGIDKLRGFMEKCAMKKAQKGVHTSGGFSGLEEKGQSQAGRLIERAKEPQPNKYLSDLYHERGKQMHRDNLKELKEMPKPNLPKSEKNGGKIGS